MANYFEGWYFKHQKGENTLALIPGMSDTESFIQIVTNERAYQVEYPLQAFIRQNPVAIAENLFDLRGIALNIQTDEVTLTGEIRYENRAAYKGDIMGPFKYFPMECRHSVLSMSHSLYGSVALNGKLLDFTGGTGYIEGDRGVSFPSKYTWIHSNAFDEPLSVMVSVAKIPFFGTVFLGCICFVLYKGKESRLATYKGVKVRSNSQDKIEIEQGKYRLLIEPYGQGGHGLPAPDKGKMSRIIHENPSCEARFQFSCNNHIVFDKISPYTSFEHVE